MRNLDAYPRLWMEYRCWRQDTRSKDILKGISGHYICFGPYTNSQRDQYIHMQTKHPGTYNKVVHAHIGSCDRGVQLQQLIAESPWVKNRRLVRRSWTASDSLSHSGRLVWHSRQRIRLHLAELIVILLHLCKDGFDLGEQPWICPPIEP